MPCDRLTATTCGLTTAPFQAYRHRTMTTQPSPPIRDIGRKQFSVQDQEAFASWSADRNPMHVDGVAARRLLTGQPVVHGVHVLITALEFWDRADGMFPVSLDCTFNNAVNVGDPVVF